MTTYKRRLQTSQCPTKRVIDEPMMSSAQSFLAWIKEQSPNLDEATLLAYASDGVIWGEVENGQLHLAPPPSPAWEPDHLLEVWLFNPGEAWHLWRDEQTQWRGWYLKEQGGNSQQAMCQYYDEPYLLWGTHYEGKENGFTVVSEGERGLRQAVPLQVAPSSFQDGHHPLCLWMRHYVGMEIHHYSETNRYNVLHLTLLSRPLRLGIDERY